MAIWNLKFKKHSDLLNEQAKYAEEHKLAVALQDFQEDDRIRKAIESVLGIVSKTAMARVKYPVDHDYDIRLEAIGALKAIDEITNKIQQLISNGEKALQSYKAIEEELRRRNKSGTR